MRKRCFRPTALAGLLGALLCFTPATASAHVGTGIVGGFVSGFAHPVTGLDHMLAMVAVGLWGAFLGDAICGCCRSSSRW